VSTHPQEGWPGVLDEHPAIEYAARPTSDRVGRLNAALANHARTLTRDPRTGYLASLLDALNVPKESQLLVFSKTGVQRAFTSPQTPRALYFSDSVVVGFVPGAPMIEVAAHDAQQGVVFYTLDSAAAEPSLVRRTSCLTCHVSASTLNVPGLIARSNFVGDDGSVVPQGDSHDVNHTTAHPDRWGGWYVTQEGAPAPYSQRGHLGNITFSPQGHTSSQVFVDWQLGSPHAGTYLLDSSDTVSLLAFDHQTRAINLLTRLNWEARVAAASRHEPLEQDDVLRLVHELADYLLFSGEAALPVPLTPLPGFAEHLRARTPSDRHGRSFGQLELTTRLLRYPCSYMVYSEAFDGLPAPVRLAVYRRMQDVLSGRQTRDVSARISSDDRRAILDILTDTKPDFPRQ
jgi:hypothetical protein